MSTDIQNSFILGSAINFQQDPFYISHGILSVSLQIQKIRNSTNLIYGIQ